MFISFFFTLFFLSLLVSSLLPFQISADRQKEYIERSVGYYSLPKTFHFSFSLWGLIDDEQLVQLSLCPSDYPVVKNIELVSHRERKALLLFCKMLNTLLRCLFPRLRRFASSQRQIVLCHQNLQIDSISELYYCCCYFSQVMSSLMLCLLKMVYILQEKKEIENIIIFIPKRFIPSKLEFYGIENGYFERKVYFPTKYV